jgi:hypothetical protein
LPGDREEEESGGLVDELENQTITAVRDVSSSERSVQEQQLQQQLDKGQAAVRCERKVIGDEFYREEEEEEEKDSLEEIEKEKTVADDENQTTILTQEGCVDEDSVLTGTDIAPAVAVLPTACESIRDIQEDIKTSPVQSPLTAPVGTDDRRSTVEEEQQQAVPPVEERAAASCPELSAAVSSCCPPTPPPPPQRCQPTSVLVYTAKKSVHPIHKEAPPAHLEEYFNVEPFYSDDDAEKSLFAAPSDEAACPVRYRSFSDETAVSGASSVFSGETAVSGAAAVFSGGYLPAAATTGISSLVPGGQRAVTTPPEVAVAALASVREPGRRQRHLADFF